MPDIHAERLQAALKSKGWTQERLAEAVGISREQCGKHLRKSGLIRVNEQTARGYERVLGLSREELSKAPKAATQMPSGWTRITIPMTDEEHLVLRMTAMRYQTDPLSILRLSSVLFTIVAEQQLAERACRIAAVEQQMQGVSDGIEHLANIIRGAGQIEEALWREKAAIAAKDITGGTIPGDDWNEHRSEGGNLFEVFLERRLEELASDIYQPFYGSPQRDLFQEQIEDLSQGDLLARMALLRRDVQPQDVVDIPPADRIAFLHARCSAATRTAHDEFVALCGASGLDDLGL